jgi:hypothetical protein
MPSGELAENAKRFVAGTEMVSAPQMSLPRAAELCSTGGWIIVTGSLHLIGALRPLVLAKPNS